MIETIQIGSKTYTMKSSVHMLLRYRQRFDEELLTRIGSLDKKRRLVGKEDAESAMTLMSDMLDLGTKLAYIMVCEEKDDNSMDYDTFVKELDTEEITWVNEVIALAMTTFRGNIPNQTNRKKQRTRVQYL